MEKVIFDTNFLLEKRMKNFFGKQNELIKFDAVSEIIIPDMVMGELTEKYKRIFRDEKNKFNKQALPNVLEHNINSINIEDSIGCLIQNIKVSYEVIELNNPNILYEMKELALKKAPPFVPDDGSDKGFKDAYIYFTVLEYFQSIDDQYLFFATNDKLFKEAFKDNPNIKVIENYDEFIKQSASEFYDDYFIDKLNNFISELGTLPIRSIVKQENIINYFISDDNNKIITINIDDKNYLIEVDSGEILSCELEDLE